MSKLATATASAPPYSSMSRQKFSSSADEKDFMDSNSKESVANKIAQSISAPEEEDDEVDLSQPQSQITLSASKNPIDVSSDEERNGVRTRRGIRKKNSKAVMNGKTDPTSIEEIAYKSQAKHFNGKKNELKLNREKEQIISVTDNDEYTDHSSAESEDFSRPVLKGLADKPKSKPKKTELKYKSQRKKATGFVIKKRDLFPLSSGPTNQLSAHPPLKKVKTTPYADTTPQINVEPIDDSVAPAETHLFISPTTEAGPIPPITATTTISAAETADKHESSTYSPGTATTSKTIPKNKKKVKIKPHDNAAQTLKPTVLSLQPFLNLKHPFDGPTAADTFINYIILNLQPANAINRTPYLYQLWDPNHEFEIQMSQKNVEAQIDLRFTSHTEALFKLLHMATTRISLSLQLITFSTPSSTSSESISFLLIFASWMCQNFVHHEELLTILPLNINNQNPFEDIVALVNETTKSFNISERLLAVTIDAGVGQFCTVESIANELSNTASDSAISQNYQIYGINSLSSSLDLVARMFLNCIDGGKAWTAAMIYTQCMPTFSVLDRLRMILHHFVGNSIDGQKDWECLFSYISDYQKNDRPILYHKCVMPDSPLSTKSTYIMLRDAVALREIIDRAVTLIPALQRYYINDNEWKLINDIYKLLHILYWCHSLVSGSPESSSSEPRFVLYILTLKKICDFIDGISRNESSGLFKSFDPNLLSVFVNAFKIPETMWLINSQEWPSLGFLASLLDPRQMDVVITDIVGPEKALEWREVLDHFADQYDNLSPVIDIDESDGEPVVVDVMGIGPTRAKKEASKNENKQFHHQDLNYLTDETILLKGKDVALKDTDDLAESPSPRTHQFTDGDGNEENLSDADTNNSDQEISTQESESEDDVEFAALADKLVLGVPATHQKAQMNDYFTEQLLSYTDLTDSELMLRWWVANGKSHLEYAAAARDVFSVSPSVEGIATRVLGPQFRTLLGDRIENLSFPWLHKLVCIYSYTRSKVK